jgi:hypothetical protein
MAQPSTFTQATSARLTTVHNAYPNKNVYFTEQWVGAPSNFGGDLGWHINTLIIGATRNWSRNVLEWNLAADPNNNPHTNGGCSTCLGRYYRKRYFHYPQRWLLHYCPCIKSGTAGRSAHSIKHCRQHTKRGL